MADPTTALNAGTCYDWPLLSACWSPEHLLSLLGLIAAAVAFAVGLWQYRTAQSWKRKEFMVAEIDKLHNSPQSRNALAMLDYTSRWIELFPLYQAQHLRFTRSTRLWVAAALMPHTVKGRPKFKPEEAAIRECFDDLLTRLDNLHDMIETKLIKQVDLQQHLRYWIERICGTAAERAQARPKVVDQAGAPLKLSDAQISRLFREHLWLFINSYGYSGVQALCKSFGSPVTMTEEQVTQLSHQIEVECGTDFWNAEVAEARKISKERADGWRQQNDPAP